MRAAAVLALCFLLLKDTGARNERRFAAVFMGKSPGFETLQGLLDHVMKMLEVRHSAGCRVWWWGGGRGCTFGTC